MKTQIIALEAHDDFISVRDRMSWAKSPRILLIWPKFEKISLRAADLRILQQHAATLGAEMGIITRRGDVRRDAERFDIPVFSSTAAAQRDVWPRRRPAAIPPADRPRRDRIQLEEMKRLALPAEAGWRNRPGTRIGFFLLGVCAVLAVAAVFLPRATVTLVPLSQAQRLTVPVSASPSIASVTISGTVPAHEITVTVGGSQSARVATQSSIPDQRAQGIARFTNLTQSDVTIPAGTIVYSLSPAAVQFATLNETHLAGNVNAMVEVPILSVNGGADANLPANAIQAIQGNLGLSAAVTNPEPTTGGSDRVTAAPSDADRQRLHDVVVDLLKTQAEAQVSESIGANDVILPGSLQMGAVKEETFDPPAGKPGNLLKLTLRAEFHAQYVKAIDLEQLARVTLDAAKPPDFTPVEGSLHYQLGPEQAGGAGDAQFKLDAERVVAKELDISRIGALVLGKSPGAAAEALQANLPLANPPEIHLSPSWWPWMPLIPFRISVTSGV